MIINNQFSSVISVFQDLYLPEQDVRLAGYSALIHAYQLQVPLPRILAAISHKTTNYEKDRWKMFSPRYLPKCTLFAHITFALKYEGVDLFILKALFSVISTEEIIRIVKLEPTSAYSRRIWFLYEWLLNIKIDLPDAITGNFVNVLDERLQFPGPVRMSRRHRVRNNLPGVPGFCPIIYKTNKISKFLEMNLSEHVKKLIGQIHKDVLMRAAAFMLLKDSKASFAIEGETPSPTRAERWAQTIGQAAFYPLSHEEFLRLQELIIADFRFVHYGYRNEGGFIGEHERGSGLPIPDHISARYQDIMSLMNSLIQTNQLLKESDIDPVVAAAVIAFGFVFIHPFEDGNGRIHRYLIHHVLAEKNFTSKNIVFPVSSVLLEHIDKYKEVLEAYSKSRLPFIKWMPTVKGNVDVLNDTIDLYRYFDATIQAEFLFECIFETIEKTLPEEINYLERYDRMKHFIANYIDMPDRLIDLLIRFLIQENGKLSKRARNKEFKALTQEEVLILEEKFAEIFLL